MATRRAKKTAPAVAPVLSPWTLCIWRGEQERCHFALVRWTQAVQPGWVTAGMEAMFVDGLGCIQWKQYPPQWRTARGELRDSFGLAIPTSVKTTVTQMQEYFRRRLLLVGGHPKAYEAFGLPRPIMTQAETDGDPKKAADLSELYARAAKLLGAEEEALREKYSHLNRGLQAMNLRNRLRAKGHNV